MDQPRQEKIKITFDDLPLLEAIHQLSSDGDYVMSEIPLISDAGREWTLQKIISLLSHGTVGKYRFERILLLVNQFRKLNQASRKKRLLILEHARNLKSPRCFYADKLSTACSDEIDLDRVKPS